MKSLALRSLQFSVVLGLILNAVPAGAEEKEDEKPKTTEAKIDEALTLKVPETWKQEPPANKLRKAQFVIPAAKGDKEDVELVIFSFGGGGGSVTDNIKRWEGQFQEEGRKSKRTLGESPHGKYIFVDVTGTYNKPDGPPFLQKTVPLPEARMLAVILAVEDAKAVYYLRMAGEEKTVSGAEEAFRASFGGEEEKEKKFEAAQ